MKPATALLNLVPAVAVIIFLTLLARQEEASARLGIRTASAACVNPVALTPAYQVEEGALRPTGTGWTFQSTSWLTAKACQAGRLTIRAQGQAANGQSPRLSVFLNSTSLGDFPIRRHETLSVTIPSGGQLTLAYFNDYYSQEARVAFVGQVRLTGPGCTTAKVNVPPETGGHWYEDYNFATLNTGFPLQIIPCRSGELALALWGRLAGEDYPQIELRQAGRSLGIWKTDARPQQTQVSVSERPIEVRLLNPYGKLLADRNLYLEQWSFEPQSPPER